jgi:hypothetical protein
MTATTIAFSGTLQSSIGTTYVSQPASDGCRPNSLHFHTLQERLMLVDCLQLCEIGASNSAQARRALDATKRTPSGMKICRYIILLILQRGKENPMKTASLRN